MTVLIIGSRIVSLSYNSMIIFIILTTLDLILVISGIFRLLNCRVILDSNTSSLHWTHLSQFPNYMSSQSFTPPFMRLTLFSSASSLVMSSVHMAYEFIISSKDILCGVSGTDCTRVRPLELPTSSVCVVSVCSPVLEPQRSQLAGAYQPLNFLFALPTGPRRLDVSLIRPRSVVFVASNISSIPRCSFTPTARHIYMIMQGYADREFSPPTIRSLIS